MWKDDGLLEAMTQMFSECYLVTFYGGPERLIRDEKTHCNRINKNNNTRSNVETQHKIKTQQGQQHSNKGHTTKAENNSKSNDAM